MLVSALTNKMVELTLDGVNFNLARQGQQTNKKKEKTIQNLQLYKSFYTIPKPLLFFFKLICLSRKNILKVIMIYCTLAKGFLVSRTFGYLWSFPKTQRLFLYKKFVTLWLLLLLFVHWVGWKKHIYALGPIFSKD